MTYNRCAIMKYARLLVEMEKFSKSYALTRAWIDAREIAKWVMNGETKYVCSFQMVVAPGVRWVTPDQDWDEYHSKKGE